MTMNVNLDEEYRLTRAALVKAGIDMTDSIDALYRDWRRWREKPKTKGAGRSLRVANPDQWWAQHLAQFRALLDPLHVAARAERVRKDRIAVRTRPQVAEATTPENVIVQPAV
ncbi:MAG TPA: hypothetical protein VHY56_08605 [Candidatus Binataceae bacterium]|jgi:hypothetical protein|nr:hypothetical protein [Candidatus Binataceae bacterium]